MTKFVTPSEAAQSMLCPLARVFGGDLKAHCKGETCAVWRWKPRMASDPEFITAVKREKARLAEESGKSPEAFNAVASKAVAADPEAHGVTVTTGFCGLGGLPT